MAIAAASSNYPFGEEIGSEIGGRNTVPQYGQMDSVKQKFTGKERDSETGLDYVLTRYYSAMQGRFISVDPFNIIAENERSKNKREHDKLLIRYLFQPQNWNRYTYTRNSPLTYTDPDGQCSAPSGLAKGNIGICIEAFIATSTINKIGRGDNRDFSANDPTLSSRVQVSGVISRSAFAWNSKLTVTAGRSEVLTEGFGLLGKAKITGGGQTVDKDGNLHLKLRITGVNGFSGLPGAPEGEIKINANQ